MLRLEELGLGSWNGLDRTNWEQIKQVGNWNGYQLKRKLGFNKCLDDKKGWSIESWSDWED